MQRVVILGTGGTIAGTGHDPSRAWVYQAAQLSVAQLVEAIPALQGVALEAVQVAQVDSKDVSWSVWRQLGQALAHHLAREEVAGVVITHGTDTLEETACMLHALHDGSKPVVLTAAMRPATAPDADGPLNLCAAVAVVQEAARCHQGGVVAVLQGRVWAGLQVRKAHSHALDAFDGGGAPPLSHLPAGPLTWPTCSGLGWHWLDADPPRVEMVCSHADADGWVVRAMLAHNRTTERPLKGVVVVGTGHGTVHEGLAQALREAAQQGVTVWRSTRVARGGVQVREGDEWPGVPDLTSAQARVMLTLSLMGAVHLV
jgi:L-asparaginase